MSPGRTSIAVKLACGLLVACSAPPERSRSSAAMGNFAGQAGVGTAGTFSPGWAGSSGMSSSATDTDAAAPTLGPTLDAGGSTPGAVDAGSLGPDDGDPNGPIVSAPGVPCGANPSLLGLTTTNAKIGGRDVHIAYPCNKHKGAPMVFILNLHGTMPDEQYKLYQVAYFSINNLVESHNFITAAPKSVVSQWGNGDNGVDEPHIMEVIDWVYTTFADFDIRAMWIAGHSWGAMYSTEFACRPALASKVRGAVLMSGMGQKPSCADRLSIISSAAETDIGPVIAQDPLPSTHGCGASMTNMIGNNVETFWPHCQAGYAHANYFMLGKGHSDYIDAEVVTRIGDLIKAARP